MHLFLERNSTSLYLSFLTCKMELQIQLCYNDKFLNESTGLFANNIAIRFSAFVVEFCYYFNVFISIYILALHV